MGGTNEIVKYDKVDGGKKLTNSNGPASLKGEEFIIKMKRGPMKDTRLRKSDNTNVKRAPNAAIGGWSTDLYMPPGEYVAYSLRILETITKM